MKEYPEKEAPLRVFNREPGAWMNQSQSIPMPNGKVCGDLQQTGCKLATVFPVQWGGPPEGFFFFLGGEVKGSCKDHRFEVPDFDRLPQIPLLKSPDSFWSQGENQLR